MEGNNFSKFPGHVTDQTEKTAPADRLPRAINVFFFFKCGSAQISTKTRKSYTILFVS
jgi:hypothetical protein